MDSEPGSGRQTYSPWTVVNVVFTHLVDNGLQPALGVGCNPGEPAAELLRALGVTPSPEGDARLKQRVHADLARMRASMEPELTETEE